MKMLERKQVVLEWNFQHQKIDMFHGIMVYSVLVMFNQFIICLMEYVIIGSVLIMDRSYLFKKENSNLWTLDVKCELYNLIMLSFVNFEFFR